MLLFFRAAETSANETVPTGLQRTIEPVLDGGPGGVDRDLLALEVTDPGKFPRVIPFFAHDQRGGNRRLLVVERGDHLERHFLARLDRRTSGVEKRNSDATRTDVKVAGRGLEEHVGPARDPFELQFQPFVGEVPLLDTHKERGIDEEGYVPDRDLCEFCRLARPIRVRRLLAVVVAATGGGRQDGHHCKEHKYPTLHSLLQGCGCV